MQTGPSEAMKTCDAHQHPACVWEVNARGAGDRHPLHWRPRLPPTTGSLHNRPISGPPPPPGPPWPTFLPPVSPAPISPGTWLLTWWTRMQCTFIPAPPCPPSITISNHHHRRRRRHCFNTMLTPLPPLQSCHMAFETVDQDAVHLCTGNPLPRDIEQAVHWLFNSSFREAYESEYHKEHEG